MMASDTHFAGSIPEVYERFLVPLIFEPYAQDLAARVAAVNPGAVLEVAAGTGVVTRALAARLPAQAGIVATDLNQPMLDIAARGLGDRRVTWRQADALALPFDDRSFDAVVCQFGAQFFPDKAKAYREARRVLKPGGNFFFNVWDRISENEFADTAEQTLAALFPGDPPRFMSRIAHGYHDVNAICAELTAAGFTDIAIESVEKRSKAASARDPAIAYCEGTPLRNEIEARGGLEVATNAAADALARKFGSGPIEGKIRAIVVAGSG